MPNHRVFVYGTLKSGNQVRGMHMMDGEDRYYLGNIEISKFDYEQYSKDPELQGNLFYEPGAYAELIDDNSMTAKSEYFLYHLGAFPAVTKGGKDRIAGEVWEVDDAGLQELDWREGHPQFYKREKVSTTTGTAWMYFLTPDQIANNYRQQEAMMVKGPKGQPVSWPEDVQSKV